MRATKRIMKTLDWVILILAIFVVIAIGYKITDGGIDPSSVQTKTKKVTIQVEAYAKERQMLEYIEVGSQLADAKRDLNATVTAVEIIDLKAPRVIMDEKKMETVAVEQSKAIVTIEAEVEVKGPVLKLGSQEVRTGMMIFLESNIYKFSSRVLKVEE